MQFPKNEKSEDRTCCYRLYEYEQNTNGQFQEIWSKEYQSLREIANELRQPEGSVGDGIVNYLLNLERPEAIVLRKTSIAQEEWGRRESALCEKIKTDLYAIKGDPPSEGNATLENLRDYFRNLAHRANSFLDCYGVNTPKIDYKIIEIDL
ncbi:MAG: hypothetical protein MPJ24_06290 [Pirellulaceae bacterium]|nr:hypothetical protein [Pirellulaceae bacterium]